MIALLRTYATPLTTGLFLVSLVSGVALFLGFAPRTFHEMHEILSLVLILPFALHLWRNWRAFSVYFKRTPMAVALALSLAWAGVYVWEAQQPSDGRVGGPPPFQLAAAVARQPLAAVAPALGTDLATLTAKLEAAGFAGAGAEATLQGLAAANGREAFDIYRAALN